MGQPVSVDAFAGDDPEVGELLDERTDGMTGQVAGAEKLPSLGRRVEAVVATGAEPSRFSCASAWIRA